MREDYYEQLDDVIDELVSMTRSIERALNNATTALLTADADIADQVITADQWVDATRERIEDHAFELLALQRPVAGDLRMLVAALRMVGDIERMGDLAVHVAKVASRRAPAPAVPPELLSTLERMAAIAAQMIAAAAQVIAQRDTDGARDLELADDEMDDLRRASFRLTLDASWTHGIEPAVDIALLGRYYERIADHAVSLARRVAYLVTGERTATPSGR